MGVQDQGKLANARLEHLLITDPKKRALYILKYEFTQMSSDSQYIGLRPMRYYYPSYKYSLEFTEETQYIFSKCTVFFPGRKRGTILIILNS